MKVAPFWASVALLIPRALTVLAESTGTPAAPTTSSTATAPSCTASLITTLCDYTEPGPEFAVASDGKPHCWGYCNAHPPCSFVIFAAGNPYLGTGTCWLYPGETFDASKGSSSGCSNPWLSVYDKPTCSGGSPTTTSGACTATATPSAIASVCGYPVPEDCPRNCYASSGAPNCLSLCTEADSCSFAIFNPHNPSNSPYADGTCWVYPNGTFDAGSATTCSGAPEQFVYNNPCPKPSKPSPSSSTPESPAAEHDGSSTGTAAAAAAAAATTSSKNSASAGLSLINPLAIGVAMLLWRVL